MISGVADATVYRNTSVVNHALGITDPGRGAVEIPAPMFGYRVVTPSYFRIGGLALEVKLFFLRQLLQVRLVGDREDQQVPVRVRIAIDDDGGCAIHVVVAVNQNSLVLIDRAPQPLHSLGHAGQPIRIVQQFDPGRIRPRRHR